MASRSKNVYSPLCISSLTPLSAKVTEPPQEMVSPRFIRDLTNCTASSFVGAYTAGILFFARASMVRPIRASVTKRLFPSNFSPTPSLRFHSSIVRLVKGEIKPFTGRKWAVCRFPMFDKRRRFPQSSKEAVENGAVPFRLI